MQPRQYSTYAKSVLSAYTRTHTLTPCTINAYVHDYDYQCHFKVQRYNKNDMNRARHDIAWQHGSMASHGTMIHWLWKRNVSNVTWPKLWQTISTERLHCQMRLLLWDSVWVCLCVLLIGQCGVRYICVNMYVSAFYSRALVLSMPLLPLFYSVFRMQRAHCDYFLSFVDLFTHTGISLLRFRTRSDCD